MNSRRKFLKYMVAVGAALGIAGPLKAKRAFIKDEKVKMMTPDGKIVLVEKSHVQQAKKSERATNKEVKNWMNTKSIRN